MVERFYNELKKQSVGICVVYKQVLQYQKGQTNKNKQGGMGGYIHLLLHFRKENNNQSVFCVLVTVLSL